MRTRVTAAAIGLALTAAAQEGTLEKALARVAEEAEAFRSAAPKVLGEETLRQRAVSKLARFRPRIGGDTKPPEVKYKTREIVSEYSFSTLRESPNVLHEFREVVAVDGRPVKTREMARRTLTLGVTSQDDRVKKKMLENFEKHGLVGAATDFGQVILLFGKRRFDDYQFAFAGKSRIREQDVIGFSFRQREGKESMTIFEGRRVIRRPLQGELWVRETDYLPVRVVLSALHEQGANTAVDEATVDYSMSKYGALLPDSVVHRQRVAGQVVVENAFQYASYRMFSAETEVKFTELPAGEKKP